MTLYEALKKHSNKKFIIISSRNDSDLIGYAIDNTDVWSALEYCIDEIDRLLYKLAYMYVWEIDLENMTILLDD